MQKCQNIVSIEYKGEKHKKGSAFILPVLNNECMFLITAHHIFDYSSTIDANLISLVGLDKSELSFDYDSEYIINKELDLCILKLKYRDGFCCPIISSPHENEKVLMFGFPDVLSKATRIYHALNCTIEELRDDRVFAKIVDDISNYMNDDHKMIEGFSGCPFISYMESDSICFLGIENKTETDDASYKLVEGITGIFISHYIYNSFYKDKDIDIAELFFIQNPNDHYIATSEENYVVAFRNSVKRSKNNIMRIDDVLGNGFVLERSEIIDKITSSNSQFITIYGEAGSGKSALAKRVVKEQRYVLFARAEQFVREESLNNIWNFDLYELLKHVTNISVYIVIDAFEFIADKSKRYNLLFQLYDLTSQNRNVTIIATCRESDKSAFLQLESNYNVQCFEVEPISAHELDDISSTFETIRQMRKNGQYSQLLKFPFYINIIIRNNINIDDINDQNSFRELIYSRIICLNEKLDKYNLSSEDIVSVINEITFRRAKGFLLGINKDELKSNVLKALISEGVVIEKEGYIRLRYDIFEDIVFEHEFDKEFVKCRGIYNVFYETITGFGRCVYRRYQIWIANKLFIKDSREKFIYHLLFADDSDEEWNKQTIIGIVKSDYCVEFFNEYNADLVANGILQRFIDIINLYAFFPRVSESKKMQLTPIGKARGEIICIINDNKIELTNSVNEYSIIKLCNDYSLSSYQNSQYSFAACCIIESIIDNKKVDEKYYYSAETRICPLLSILYRLANACVDWINAFLDTIIEYYRNDIREYKHFSEDVIRFTLRNATNYLALNNYEKLIEIATLYWIEKDNSLYYYDTYFNRSNEYGLNKNADNYHFEFKTAEDNMFFCCMIKSKFNYTLEWTINFINEAMAYYFKDDRLDEYKITLLFVEENKVREYYASDQFWLMGIQDYSGHELLSDFIYLLKRMIILNLEAHKDDRIIFEQFANHVKTILYSKSNNIALLTIIEEIGLHFSNELPGYALDLVSSIEMLLCDNSRFILYIPNSTKDFLKKQIFASIGIPSDMIKERYKLDNKCNFSLQQYVLQTYILFDGLRAKCNSICDYLYSIYPNCEENIKENFQIQRMDGRNIKVERIDEEHIALVPSITGEAEKLVNEHDEQDAYKHELTALLNRCHISNEEKPDYEYINTTIDYILKLSNERLDIKIEFEQILITLICIVLKNESTSNDRREYLCDIWLIKLEGIFDSNHPIVEVAIVKILLEQVYSPVSNDIKNRIKCFIFNTNLKSK